MHRRSSSRSCSRGIKNRDSGRKRQIVEVTPVASKAIEKTQAVNVLNAVSASVCSVTNCVAPVTHRDRFCRCVYMLVFLLVLSEGFVVILVGVDVQSSSRRAKLSQEVLRTTISSDVYRCALGRPVFTFQASACQTVSPVFVFEVFAALRRGVKRRPV